MKYYITLMNRSGVIEEHALDLDIPLDTKWTDFVNLKPVKDLLRERPTLEVLDITPEDMLHVAENFDIDETDETIEDEKND